MVPSRLDDYLSLSGALRGIVHRDLKPANNIGQGLRQRRWSLERSTLDVLHYKVVRPDIMQRANVGMIQGGYGVRFSLEAFGELFIRNLDRDNAIQPRVT